MGFFLRPRERDVVPNSREERPVRRGDPFIAQVAGEQRGLVTHAELQDAGLARGSISHRVGRKRLHRIHRGVYLVGHEVAPTLAPELAALLAIGDDAAISFQTAGGLWVITPAVPGDVHVTVPRDLKSRKGIRIHQRSLAEEDLRCLHGLRVTSPARTLLDLATVLERDALERAAEQAQMRRLITRPAVSTMLARAPGARGTRALRDALLLDEDPVLLRSKAERLLRQLLRESGLPQPAVNCHVAGRERDFVWHEQKLVVELDGWQFHGTRAAFERDRRRDAELVALGYRVLRVTWWRVTREPQALLAQLRRALEAR